MKLIQVGVTENGYPVVANLFKLFDTHGTPLEVIFLGCKNTNIVPSWLHFYGEASQHGWSHKTIMSRLIPAITDVYGKDYSEIVEQRLNGDYHVTRSA